MHVRIVGIEWSPWHVYYCCRNLCVKLRNDDIGYYIRWAHAYWRCELHHADSFGELWKYFSASNVPYLPTLLPSLRTERRTYRLRAHTEHIIYIVLQNSSLCWRSTNKFANTLVKHHYYAVGLIRIPTSTFAASRKKKTIRVRVQKQI